jgi:hypothetical protein
VLRFEERCSLFVIFFALLHGNGELWFSARPRSPQKEIS